MAIAANQFFRWEALCEMYLQEVRFAIDYRLTSGTDIPLEEANNDFRSHFKSWILAWVTEDLHVVEYTLKVYDHLTYTPATDDDPEKLKVWYGESHAITADTSDVGRQGDPGLPTFVTVSGRKIPSGKCTAFNQNGTYTNDQTPDAQAKGKISMSGITEEMTQDAQANKLAVVVGADWLATWTDSFTKFVKPSFRVGTLGTVYESTMQIKSLYGPGGAVRKTGEDSGAYIYFRPVSSIVANEFVGSQLTRKQRKKFQ